MNEAIPARDASAKDAPWKRIALASCAAAALALVLHAQALDNPAIEPGALGLPVPAGIRFPLTTGAVLAWLAHGLVSALVVLLVMRLSGDLLAGLAAGLIFAAHPVNVEALAWSEARSIPVAMLLALAGSMLWSWAGGRDKARWLRGAIGFAAWGMILPGALLSPSAAAVPLCVIAATEYRRRTHGAGQRDATTCAPFYVPALLLVVVVLLYGRPRPAPTGPVLQVLLYALGSMFVPWRLVPDYRLVHVATGVMSAAVNIGGLLVIGAALWLGRRRFRAGLAAYAWGLAAFGICLVMIEGYRADRALYLALIGVVWVAAEALILLPRGAAVAALVLAVGLYGTKTIYQHAAWQGEEEVLALFLKRVPASGQLEVARRYSRLGEEKERAARELERRAGELSEDERVELAEDLRQTASRLSSEATALFRRAVSALYKAETARGADDPDLLSTRGTLDFRLGDYAGARERLEKAVEKTQPGPERAELLVLLGVISERIGYRDEAVKLYRQATEDEPANAGAFIALSTAYALKGKLSEALASLKSAADLRPQDAGLHNRLGRILMDMLMFEEAEKAFMAACEADPGNRKFRDDLDAIRRLMAGRKPDPAKAKEAFEKGEALEARRVFIAAAEAYKVAIAHAPGNHAAHFRCGVCLSLTAAEAKKYDEKNMYLRKAVDHFRAALAFAPGNEDCLFALARAQRDLGRTREAASALGIILKLNPRSGRAHYRLAELYAVQTRDPSRARAELEEAERLGFEPAPEFLAELQDLEFGRPTANEKGAERASRAASSAAEIFLQQKDFASAAATYARSYEALSGLERPRLVRMRAHAAYMAAAAWEKAGGFRKALEWLEKAKNAAEPTPGYYDDDIKRVRGLIAEPKGGSND